MRCSQILTNDKNLQPVDHDLDTPGILEFWSNLQRLGWWSIWIHLKFAGDLATSWKNPRSSQSGLRPQSEILSTESSIIWTQYQWRISSCRKVCFFNNGSRSSIFFPEKVYRQKVNRPKQQWLNNSHLNIKLCWFLCPMFFDWEGISTSDLYKLLRYLFCPEKAAWHLSVTPVPPPPVGWLVVGPLRTVEFHWVSQATLVPHAWHWHHPVFFSRGKFTNDEMMDFSTIFCAGAYKTFMWLIHFFNGRYD